MGVVVLGVNDQYRSGPVQRDDPRESRIKETVQSMPNYRNPSGGKIHTSYRLLSPSIELKRRNIPPVAGCLLACLNMRAGVLDIRAMLFPIAVSGCAIPAGRRRSESQRRVV